MPRETVPRTHRAQVKRVPALCGFQSWSIPFVVRPHCPNTIEWTHGQVLCFRITALFLPPPAKACETRQDNRNTIQLATTRLFAIEQSVHARRAAIPLRGRGGMHCPTSHRTRFRLTVDPAVFLRERLNSRSIISATTLMERSWVF